MFLPAMETMVRSRNKTTGILTRIRRTVTAFFRFFFSTTSFLCIRWMPICPMDKMIVATIRKILMP